MLELRFYNKKELEKFYEKLKNELINTTIFPTE